MEINNQSAVALTTLAHSAGTHTFVFAELINTKNSINSYTDKNIVAISCHSIHLDPCL